MSAVIGTTVVAAVSGGPLVWSGDDSWIFDEPGDYSASGLRHAWVAALVVTLLVLATLQRFASGGEVSRHAAWPIDALGVGSRMFAASLTLGTSAALVLLVGTDLASPWGLGLDVSAWLLLGSAIVWGTGLLHGFTWHDGQAATGLFTGGLDTPLFLGTALLFLVLVATVLRAVLRRQPRSTDVAGTATALGAYVILWIGLAWISKIALTEGSEDESRIGLGLVSVLICAGLIGGLALVAGVTASRWLVGWFPGTSARLAGRKVDAAWASLLIGRLARDGRRGPAYTVRMSREIADTRSKVRLPNGYVSPIMALIGASTAAALLLIPTATAACDLPLEAAFAKDRKSPSPVPPAATQQLMDETAEALRTARVRVTSQERKAGPALQKQAAYEQAAAGAAQALASRDESAQAMRRAEARVRELSDVGDWEREMLESARRDYKQFQAYDSDRFWIDRVTEAEAVLEEAEEPLRKAEAQRDASSNELLTSEAALESAQAVQGDAASALAPFRSQLERLAKSQTAAERARVEVSHLDRSWQSDLNSRRSAVERDNQLLQQCRDDSLPRVGAAAALLTLAAAFLAGWLVVLRRRRYVGRTSKELAVAREDK